MNFLDALKTFAPVILAAVPGAQPFIPLVVAGMALAESSKKKGKAKKEIALAAVKVAAETANVIAAKKGDAPVINADEAVAFADHVIDEVIVGVKQISTIEAAQSLPTVQP